MSTPIETDYLGRPVNPSTTQASGGSNYMPPASGGDHGPTPAPVSTNKTYIGQDGATYDATTNQKVTTAQNNTTQPTNSSSGGAPTPYYPYNPGGLPMNGVDPNYAGAQNNLAPGTSPTDDESFFQKIYGQLKPAIDAANDAEASAESAANIKSTQQSSANNFAMNSRGLAGSSEADNANISNENDRNAAIAQAKADQSGKVASILESIVPEAENEFQTALQRNDTNSQAYITQKKTQAQQAVKAIAQTGQSLDDLSKSNPAQYNQLLQYYDGDSNAMKADWISANQAQSLDGGKPIQSGTHLIYTFKDPVTGKVFTQDIDTGVPLDANWTATRDAAGGLYMVNKATGETKQLTSDDPTYAATKAATLQQKQESIRHTTAITANSILKSSGLLAPGSSSGSGSIPYKYYTAAPIVNRVAAALSSDPSAITDEDLVDSIVSINTGGAGRPTQAQFDQIVDNLGLSDKAGIALKKNFGDSSQFLPPSMRQDIANLVVKNFQNLKTSFGQWQQTAQSLLDTNGITQDQYDITSYTDYLNPTASITDVTGNDPTGDDTASQMEALGATDNGDGTYTMTDGTVVQVSE